MNDLIERLEKAAGPDSEIDYAIGEWLFMQGRQPWECFNYGKDGPAIKFTASIDAALTLVVNRPWVLKSVERGCEARIGGPPGIWEMHGSEAPTPAIALCIAALKARTAIKRI